jgi:hypothetical protein
MAALRPAGEGDAGEQNDAENDEGHDFTLAALCGQANRVCGVLAWHP